MPRTKINALTDARVRAALRDRAGPFKMVDGRGLRFARIKSGRTVWQLRTQGEHDRVIELGTWPQMTLAQAREAAEAQRVELRKAPNGPRPATWGTAWATYLALQRANQRATYVDDIERRVTANVPPEWNARRMDSITRQDVIDVIKPIADRGARVQALRVRALIGAVFELAIVSGNAQVNPADRTLTKAVPRPPRKVNHPACAVADVGKVFRLIEHFPGITSLALRLVILTAARTSEVRLMTWDQIDMQGALWSVPASNMKAGRPHNVPLNEPALVVLRAAWDMRRKGCPLVFPTPRGCRPLSTNAMLAALKSLGLANVTTHGFRSTFSTWAHEAGHNPDAIELSLAHKIDGGSGVRGVYMRGDMINQRRQLLDAWGTFVSGL